MFIVYMYFKILDTMLFGHDWNVLVGMFCFGYVLGRDAVSVFLTFNMFY